MTDPARPRPTSATPASLLTAGSDADADPSGSAGYDAAEIQRLRRVWREGVEGGGYQPAETVFAELSARYETPRRGA